MLALLALLAIAPFGADVPARQSRATFAHAMAQVKDYWTMAQVKRLLGPPDDVWPPNDAPQYVMAGDEAWCYGTNGHHTMPTLGYVMFREGKVLYANGGGGKPPSPKVITETELVDAMRRMYRPLDQAMRSNSDPLQLIRVANLLIPKGREKALAVLGEYDRLHPDGFDHDDWLFWLVRVMFTSNRPGGAFSVPAIGIADPPTPAGLLEWPTFPVLMMDDVPFCIYTMGALGGFPEPFGWYLQEHQGEWTIRQTRLHPPDDPFLSYKKLVASSAWPFPRLSPTQTPSRGVSAEGEGPALDRVIELVRTAYRPHRVRLPGVPADPLDYDTYHAEFLALGCRWDEASQMYVRKDGVVLGDPIAGFPQQHHQFPATPRHEVAELEKARIK
jgi:hypothetical protein